MSAQHTKCYSRARHPGTRAGRDTAARSEAQSGRDATSGLPIQLRNHFLISLLMKVFADFLYVTQDFKDDPTSPWSTPVTRLLPPCSRLSLAAFRRAITLSITDPVDESLVIIRHIERAICANRQSGRSPRHFSIF